MAAFVPVSLPDREADRTHEALLRGCGTLMMEDPRSIVRIMEIIWYVRSLWRIGDHSRNIARHVVYFARHVRRKFGSMEREIHG